MIKQFFFLATALSFVAFGANAVETCSKDSDCKSPKICCPAGLFQECVDPNPIGGCP